MAAIIIIREVKDVNSFSHRVVIDQFLIFISRPIDKRIITSPTRFIRAVIIPAAKDLGFW